MNKFTWILVVLVIVLVGWKIVDSQGKKSEGPVKIGVLAPLSGIAADYGEEIRKGIMAADAPGVEFVFEDEKCDSAPALSAFKKLTELDKVSYIIGPACGAPQEVVAPLVKAKDMVVIMPSAASQKLYTDSGNKMYNIQYSLENESKFIAEQMTAKGYKNVVLITYQNAFSKTHSDSFKANFKGTILQEISFQNDTNDVATELIKIRSLKPDAIFSTDIAFFFANGLPKLRQLGVTVPVFSQYAVELPAARPLVEGVIYSFPSEIPDSEGATFGLAREAAETLAAAIGECGDKPACVRKELDNSKGFADGVKDRVMILKQITKGQPVELK